MVEGVTVVMTGVTTICGDDGGMLQVVVHQEKPTVPFITIDHYRSLFVTFVAISAIIALWHP